MKKIIPCVLFVLLILAGCATERAYRPASPPPGEFIRAQGTGKAPTRATSPEQAELLAREMAKTNAMNKLREEIQTYPVRGNLSVEQCIIRNPSIRPRVESIIQSAKVISEHLEVNGFWVELSIRYADLKAACK